MNVLVTDANNRVALAVIRALARRGARIVACEQKTMASRPAAFYSRSVVKKAWLPDVRDEGAFIDALRRLGRDVDVILPISTNVLLTVSRHLDSFRGLPARIPIASYDRLTRANRKDQLIPFAARCGIPVPQSYKEDDVLQIKFPVVVKLRDDEGLYLEPSRRYRIVDRPERFGTAYAEMNRLKDRPLIQEYIDGEGYGCSMLIGKEGSLLASFCHRRIRQYPPSGGPSTLCESVHEPRMVDLSYRLLRALGWSGIAMVEFKKDRRDGQFKLMEINPRFWGALPLAVACGVNFPDLLCRYAMGEPVTPVVSYPAGRRLRFFFMDLAAAISASCRGNGAGYLGGFVRDLFDITMDDGIWDSSDWGASMQYYFGRRV